MDKSCFPDKDSFPDETKLSGFLENTYHLWHSLKTYVNQKNPDTKEEWSFPGEKYGWSFRIKDKKRAIIYLLPREKYFRVAFVFGQKATDRIMKSKIPETIKAELQEAKVYAEGRGIRIDVKDETIIQDIKELIDIKLAF
jgi:hypothetical protein